MHVIYLDTETTDIENPRMVQLAYRLDGGDYYNEMFKPPKLISFGAMAVTHITNEMVENKPVFSESSMKGGLQILLNNSVLIAHNSPFDIKVLKAEGVETKDYICTLQVAHHVLDYDGGYSMQELRYALDLDNRYGLKDIVAHDALGDIIVLEALFKYLLEKVIGETVEAKLNAMIRMTQDPFLLKKVNFGKHKGKQWSEVDRGYLTWLLKAQYGTPKSEQDQNKIFTCEHYLNAS